MNHHSRFSCGGRTNPRISVHASSQNSAANITITTPLSDPSPRIATRTATTPAAAAATTCRGGAGAVGSAEARIWLRRGHPTGRNSGEDVGAPGGTHHPRKRPAIALEDDLDLGQPKQPLAHPGVAPIGGRAQEEP